MNVYSIHTTGNDETYYKFLIEANTFKEAFQKAEKKLLKTKGDINENLEITSIVCRGKQIPE